MQLAGDAVYFGKLVKKKYIGDGLREIEYRGYKACKQADVYYCVFV